MQRAVVAALTMFALSACSSWGVSIERDSGDLLGPDRYLLAEGTILGEPWAFYASRSFDTPQISGFGAAGGYGAGWAHGFEDLTGVDPRQVTKPVTRDDGASTIASWLVGFGPPDMARVQVRVAGGVTYEAAALTVPGSDDVTFFVIEGAGVAGPLERLRGLDAQGESLAAVDRPGYHGPARRQGTKGRVGTASLGE
jgi:hypothetical protein